MKRPRFIQVGFVMLCSVTVQAQVSAPRLGCFVDGERSFEILGFAASLVVRAVEADACASIESVWSVVKHEDDGGEPWLERRDAVTGAVEQRRKLDAGTWGVFADGALAHFDALQLPGPVRDWRLVASDWMLVRTGEISLLLHADGQWFYLPGVAE